MQKINFRKLALYFILLLILVEIIVINLLPTPKLAHIKNDDKDRTFVVILTMTRVGSTKIYNTIRKIYELSGENYYADWIGCYIDHCYNYNNPSKVHIIKAHLIQDLPSAPAIYADYKLRQNHNNNLKTIGTVYWITAKRDPRDMMASRVRVGKEGMLLLYPIDPNNFANLEKELAKSLQDYYAYRNVSDYEVNYELFVKQPEIVIKELARVLGKKLSDTQIQEIKLYLDELGDTESLKKLSKEELKTRLLNTEHITSNKQQGGYKNTFSPEIIEKMNMRFSNEIKDMGYSLDSN